MTVQARKKWPIGVAAVASVVVAALAWSYCSWNTNLLGAESFCGGRMESGEVQAALDSTGRVSQVDASVDAQRPTFSCTVERTSRFVGGEEQRVTVRTSFKEGAFPFTTHVWKTPASRSYFTGGVTGAVSQDFGGYVVLPEACWGKLRGERGEGVMAIVEAEVEKGAVDADGLARLLTRSARQVAEKAGCGTAALSAVPDLAAPSAPGKTDVGNVCGVRGFTLPKEAVVASRAESGQEQVNEGGADTWACDLHLAGSAKGVVSFSATSDKNFVEAAKNARRDSDTTRGDSGFVGREEAVLHCADGDVLFAMKGNVEYDGALRDNGIRGLANVEAHKATFQNFLDATAADHSCPRVTIP
ncbi:hypothetical protein ACGFU4_34380 [Streptomyces sp. NPDC048511]|uniref:hypothetical protein n=1 Tax=Streptomyces sp. NPDC048511 TaxID=3365562 RepID=UPI003713277E